MPAQKNLTHVFEPRGGCKAAFISRKGQVLLSGPAGTGKSRGLLEKLNRQAMKYPGMSGLIARKTAVSLGPSALKTFEKQVIKELLETDRVSWFGGSVREPPGYRYKNGSRINVGGLDNPTKIMSTEYDSIYVQEAIELVIDDWESCTSRLRNGVIPYQQLMADTNPSTPYHFLKAKADAGVIELIESRHTDNPVYFDDAGNITEAGEAYIGKLDQLTGVRKYRLRDGLWVASEGLVYEEYEPALHLIPSFPIPKHWTRYWSVDFGYRNPFVCQFWAESPDGELYLYREIYMTGKLVEEHAKDILACITDDAGRLTEPMPRAIICDHDAEGRATLEKHVNASTTAAKKNVTDGIQNVQSRLKLDARGKPRLFIFKDALVARDQSLADKKKPTCTAEEMTGYVWDAKKEAPVKENDHGCDAKRYLVNEVDTGVPIRMRWM